MNATDNSLLEKIELALSILEKLKAEICSIEERYSILNGHYSSICDEVLTKVNNMKASLNDKMLISAKETEQPELKESEERKEDYNKKDGIHEFNSVVGSTLLEDIFCYTQTQTIYNADTEQKKQKKLIIDTVAEGIEFGLDKIGDGLIYPFVLVENIYHKLEKLHRKK